MILNLTARVVHPHRPVNPARAGMILGGHSHHPLFYCKPRASGDDPAMRGTPRFAGG